MSESANPGKIAEIVRKCEFVGGRDLIRERIKYKRQYHMFIIG